jgi:hypothetical protein
MFDTKISIVVRDDLAIWQKLNVVAFLTSGVVGATSGLVGEPYEDAAGNKYNPLMIQPAIVLSADRETLKTIYGRAMERRVRFSLYIEDMFATPRRGQSRHRQAICAGRHERRRTGSARGQEARRQDHQRRADASLVQSSHPNRAVRSPTTRHHLTHGIKICPHRGGRYGFAAYC